MLEQKLFSSFKEINRKSLRNMKGTRIRIYLDELQYTLEQLNTLVNDLIIQLLNGNIFASITIFGDKNIDEKDIDAIQKRGLNKLINATTFSGLTQDDEIYSHRFCTKVSKLDIEILNKSLLEQDHGIDPTLYLKVYYYDSSYSLLVDLYDDRGMDVLLRDDRELDFVKKILQQYIPLKYQIIKS